MLRALTFVTADNPSDVHCILLLDLIEAYCGEQPGAGTDHDRRVCPSPKLPCIVLQIMKIVEGGERLGVQKGAELNRFLCGKPINTGIEVDKGQLKRQCIQAQGGFDACAFRQ